MKSNISFSLSGDFSSGSKDFEYSLKSLYSIFLFWDAMLKKNGVELELITDYNMMRYFEKGIRGGVSTVLGVSHVKIKDPKKEKNNVFGC